MQLHNFLDRVEPKARRFKIKFEVRDNDLPANTSGNHRVDGYHQAPFCWKLGIFRDQAAQDYRVLIASSIREDDVGGIIHEMGHLLFDSVTDVEYDWLGWEILFARYAKVYNAWSRSNYLYLVEYQANDREWHDLSSRERSFVIQDRVDEVLSTFSNHPAIQALPPRFRRAALNDTPAPKQGASQEA